MANKAIVTFTLPKAPPVEDLAVKLWMDDIIRVLSAIISVIQRPVIVSYTLATLPNASTRNKNDIVYVSDAVAGQQFKGSTGSAWVNLG